MTKTHLRIT